MSHTEFVTRVKLTFSARKDWLMKFFFCCQIKIFVQKNDWVAVVGKIWLEGFEELLLLWQKTKKIENLRIWEFVWKNMITLPKDN